MYRIGFCIRKDWKQRSGGDVIQLLETKAALENRYNCSIKIIDNPKDVEISNVELLHIFNMQTFKESELFLFEAIRLGIPRVLSTVYWDLEDAFFINTLSKIKIFPKNYNLKKYKKLFLELFGICAYLMDKPYSMTKKYHHSMSQFLNEFDAMLPNSIEEDKIVKSQFNSTVKSYVVENAVNQNIFRYDDFTERKGILSVARIEPIKNQLMLLSALKDFNEEVTLIGSVSKENEGYFDAILKISKEKENIKLLIGNKKQIELKQHYNRCRVHVLASFRESPGLSSLEALSTGANIVVSQNEFCPVDTYFGSLIGKHVFICDPYSKESIRNAINAAYCSPLMLESQSNYSWDITASQTYSAYQAILSKNIIK